MPTRTRSTLAAFRSDAVHFLRQLALSDDRSFRIGRHSLQLLVEPSEIEELLVTKQRSFRKGPGLLRLRSLLGDGLLTADSDRHLQTKRTVAPAFSRLEIERHRSAIPAVVESVTSKWRDGEFIDLHQEMIRIAQRVIAATLFNRCSPPDSNLVTESVAEALQRIYGPLSRCPHAGNGWNLSPQELIRMVDRILVEHHPEVNGQPDLISLLQQSGADDQSIRDEIMTFFLAGHESVATALAWTFFAVSMSHRVRTTLEAESVSTNADQIGTALSLTFTQMVISESLRLYPPAWMVSREATESVVIGGNRIAVGSILIAAPCVTHTDKRFWRRPVEFDPWRWHPDNLSADMPRFAYFPFGGGARRCIGDQFALGEMEIIIRSIASKFRLDYPGDDAAPEFDALVNLRPRAGLRMIVRRIESANPANAEHIRGALL